MTFTSVEAPTLRCCTSFKNDEATFFKDVYRSTARAAAGQTAQTVQWMPVLQLWYKYAPSAHALRYASSKRLVSSARCRPCAARELDCFGFRLPLQRGRQSAVEKLCRRLLRARVAIHQVSAHKTWVVLKKSPAGSGCSPWQEGVFGAAGTGAGAPPGAGDQDLAGGAPAAGMPAFLLGAAETTRVQR